MRSRKAARLTGSSTLTVTSEVRMVRPADQVYRTLKSQIQTGQLAPGEHLVEDTLSAQYGVSRTPVRNALRRLGDEGLVTVEPNRGAFVASWTSNDTAD